MKKTMIVVLVIAVGATGAACNRASVPPARGAPSAMDKGVEVEGRALSSAQSTDQVGILQLFPSKYRLNIKSGANILAWLWVDPTKDVHFGRETFTFAEAGRRFTGDVTLGSAGMPPIERSAYLSQYCVPAKEAYTVDRSPITCAVMNGLPVPTPRAGETTLFAGNWTNFEGQSSGDWNIATLDNAVVGSVHLQGGHEYWIVLGAPPPAQLSPSLLTYTFKQAPAQSPTVTAKVQWANFRSTGLCRSGAEANASVYDVTAVKKTDCSP